MAKGKKTPLELIYKVMLCYVANNNYSEVGRILDMPEATVRKIVKDYKDTEEFTKLCDEKKEEFVEKATRLINKATDRLETELDNKKNEIPVNHLTTVIGTLYDKRALAKGDPTNNIKISKLEDLL